VSLVDALHVRCVRRSVDSLHQCSLSAPQYRDSKTASTTNTATNIFDSELDCCNPLNHNLLKSKITRLQQIQNFLARAVVKAAKSSRVTSILRSPPGTGTPSVLTRRRRRRLRPNHNITAIDQCPPL